VLQWQETSALPFSKHFIQEVEMVAILNVGWLAIVLARLAALALVTGPEILNALGAVLVGVIVVCVVGLVLYVIAAALGLLP
jgi:hypothetical protein